MAIFVEEIAVALELIEENGEAIQIDVLQREDDPSQPWKVAPPVSPDDPVDAFGCWLSSEKSFVDGTAILEGHEIVFVPASGLAITSTTADTIIRNTSERWSIGRVKTLNPNGEVILHELQVQR